MKLKCVNKIIDKHTNKPYKKGAIYTIEDEARAKELLASVYFEEVKDEPKEPKKKKK